MLSADDLREALRVCYDAELPVNIVDLGLLHSVQLQPDTEAVGAETRFHATIVLLRRTADEQRAAMLLAQISNRLAGLYEVSRSTIQYTDEPAWTAEYMSDEARAQLGLNRRAKPGLVQISL